MTRIVEGVVTIVRGLRPAERRALVQELRREGLLTPDEQDALTIAARRRGRNDPSLPS
jgi:hypothetical protein